MRAISIPIFYASFIFVGIFCVSYPPTRPDYYPEKNSECVQIIRHENFAEVKLSVGTPRRLLRLLLTFKYDPVSIHVFNSKMLSSTTLICSETFCVDNVDFLKIADTWEAKQSDIVYRTYLDDDMQVASSLKLDGVFYLTKNESISVLSSLLCKNMPEF